MQGPGRILGMVRAARDGEPLVTLPASELRRLLHGPKFDIAGGNVALKLQPAGADPESGPCIHEQTVHNRVTLNGRIVLGDLLLNIGPAPGFIAVGTGTKAAEDNDDALQVEVFRAAVTRRYRFTGLARFKLYVSADDANGFTLTEAGLFAGTSYSTAGVPQLGGLCFARATFSSVVKDNTTQLTLTWDFPLTSGG